MNKEITLSNSQNLENSWTDIAPTQSNLDKILPLIEDATQGLLKINQKFSEHGASWLWNKSKALENDAIVLNHHIETLNIVKELNDKERKQLIQQLCSVYKILDMLHTNKYLDAKSAQKVMFASNHIQSQCFGIGRELCQIHSLLSTATQLLEASKPEEFLLDAAENSTTLVSKSIAHNTHSANTYQFLNNIRSYLKSEHIVKHLSVDDLMKLKMLSCWMMANYIKSQQQRLDLVEHIYGQLREINQAINANLAKREKSECISEANLANLNSLKIHLSEKHYFRDFWYAQSHVDELKKCKLYLKSLNDFISDPTNINIEGLTFLKKNHEAGISLYEVPSENDLRTLVIFSFNREGVLPYYNCLQNRSCKMGIGGLGHSPVYEAAEQSWGLLKELLKECNMKEENVDQIITAGFGIDGAIAQVLSFLLAKEYPKVKTRTYGMGIAPYLDINAAANVKEQVNHYAINIALKDDTRLGVSPFSNYVAKNYSKMNIHGEYEAHNRDWFMSDLSGHDRNIYVEKADPAIQQPIEMHAMYCELDQMAKNSRKYEI